MQVDRWYAMSVVLIFTAMAVLIGALVITAAHQLSASVQAPPPVRAEVHQIPNPAATCGCGCEKCRCGR